MEKNEIYQYLRVVNLRGMLDFQAKKDEKIIAVHRGNDNPLGNPYPMKMQTMKERDRVIEAYRLVLEADMAAKGAMWQALQHIAQDVVKNNQKIALSCFCAPAPCHGNLLVPIIGDMIEAIIDKENHIKIENGGVNACGVKTDVNTSFSAKLK